MASEYLLSKWKLLFQMDDANNDGILSSADIKASGTFFKLHNVDAEKTKELKTQYTKVWNDFHFVGHIRERNESQFLNDFNAEFSTNKHQFYNRMNRVLNKILKDFIDTNKDGFISEEEFINDYQTVSPENVAAVKRLFKSYKKDPIPVSTTVKSWLSFTTEEDESKESLKNMKNGLESVIKNV